MNEYLVPKSKNGYRSLNSWRNCKLTHSISVDASWHVITKKNLSNTLETASSEFTIIFLFLFLLDLFIMLKLANSSFKYFCTKPYLYLKLLALCNQRLESLRHAAVANNNGKKSKYNKHCLVKWTRITTLYSLKLMSSGTEFGSQKLVSRKN